MADVDHPDADISACRGTLDAFTTFSAICLPDSAFVLDYSTSSGLTQCYIFPNPTSLQYPNSTPFAAFLPRARRHEPGLMLCSIDGNIRVWMNVSLGLTGGEIYETTRLPLAPQEVVTTLRQIEVRRSFLIHVLGS
jgi:nuclear pore complex protein Nup133